MEPMPLFPLSSVLVPGQVLPLRVVDQSDRQLVSDVLAQPETERIFGVVPLRSGNTLRGQDTSALFRTGCTALIRRIDDSHETLNVVVTGQRRFHLYGVLKNVDLPYLQGLISELPDEDYPADQTQQELAQQVAHLFNHYRELRHEARIEFPLDTKFVSYLITVGLPLHLAERVALLSESKTIDRLLLAKQLIQREIALFTVTSSIPQQTTDIPLHHN